MTLADSSELANNVAGEYGGGADVATMTVSGDATIHDNRAGLRGGGVYVSGHLTLSGNATIHDNQAGSGGGIYATGLNKLTNCIAGIEGDPGVNVYNNTSDDIYP